MPAVGYIQNHKKFLIKARSYRSTCIMLSIHMENIEKENIWFTHYDICRLIICGK